MNRSLTGELRTISTVGGEKCEAFVPNPLPPVPPLRIDDRLREKLDEALLALGRLDSISTLLPDTSLFIYMYIRKEAILSSQIEGTQSSLSDLLLFEDSEAPGVPIDDVQEVSNYVAGLNHGLRRIKEGLPLSLRLIREIHEVLLKKGKGAGKSPGEFRRSQNWIGGSRPGNATYVPPPPDQMLSCLDNLEKFLHDQQARTPVLVKAALMHAQFETIHPFLDGNGRLGRLLITMLLYAEGVLKTPLLYLSLYFKSNREEYYGLLQQLRFDGDWERWLEFFVTGVSGTAAQAVDTADTLVRLFASDRKKIQQAAKATGSVISVHDALQQKPIVSATRLAELTGLTNPTVGTALSKLQDMGIVTEITDKKWGRRYSYTEYLRILNEGTEVT